MPAAPAATPVKPSMPATSAMTAKMRAHLSMEFSLFGPGRNAGPLMLQTTLGTAPSTRHRSAA